MGKFWLVLESYTFLWANEKNVVFYNSLSGHGEMFNITPAIDHIIRVLIEPENLYITEISKDELNNDYISNFIKKLQENFMGDIYDQKIFPHKPVIIIPSVNIANDFNDLKDNSNQLNILNKEVCQNLLEVSIYLDGNCSFNCSNCNKIQNQIPWCTSSSDKKISLLVLDKLLNQIKYTNTRRINYFINEIFNQIEFKKYLKIIQEYKINSYLYINWHRITGNLINIITNILSEINHVNIVILVDKIDNFIDNCISNIFKYNNKIFYLFAITNIIEYQKISLFVEENKINHEIYPYFNNNSSFFEEMVYFTQDEILNTKWEKKDIFSHQVMNTAFFGKLTILNNGDVVSNPNFSSIGNIHNHTLAELVHKELTQPSSWRLTRDQYTPCKNCILRYICSPISNYEIVMNISNLCHMKL